MSLNRRLGSSEIGGCKEICRPFTNPSPTPRQPFANPSPTFRHPFANLFCQPLSNPLFPWTPGTLAFRKRSLRFEIAPPKNRSDFLFLNVWAPSTCLCCFTSKKALGVCPPPRGFPWKPLLRVSVCGMLVCELALLVCDNVWYYVTVLSCLQVVSLAVCFQRGLSGRTFSGVPVPFLNLECYCASRGGYLGGGASAPRYQGPLERLSREAGRPMGPSTPLCLSQSCAFVCLVSC